MRPNLMLQRVFLSTALAAVLMVVAACGSRSGQARPRSTAALSIIEPSPGTVASATKVRIRLKLDGGRVVVQTSSTLTPDEGHIHLTLNGTVSSMTFGLDQEIAVGKGPQLLQAEFVALDHLPFDPRIIATVTFVVR